jgi:outer membrane receptor protein involved in Fe transport
VIGKNATYNTYLPAMHFADVNLSRSFNNGKWTLQGGVKNIFNIGQVNLLGGSSNSIHNSDRQQAVSPGRSVFVGIRMS